MIYISPPFGNYLSYKNAVRIRGTFTWKRRKGLLYHTARSLRPVKGGWRNQIGFRNKGIRNVKFNTEDIFSICGLEPMDWYDLLWYIPKEISLELNVGCPNVHHTDIPLTLLSEYVEKFDAIQVKLPPTVSMKQVENIIAAGVKTLHVSNTIPTPKGGISGAELKEVNLPLVSSISKMGVRIIAGGGIYNKGDIDEYQQAGAEGFSISTVCISRPWNVPRIYAATTGVEV
jgi:dihydroorotate dehydrogenase|tara:strand:- start:517 stop:1206 length:690 start_codon:yes stop_codon:yes gene_type:complete